MLDNRMDRRLFINTTGIREWKDKNVEFNRCESTPYKALNELFVHYKIKDTDQFVDFGCGRGRVAFYVHHKFKIPVSGVEVNDTTFDELLNNQRSYEHKYDNIKAPLYFEYGYAENYDIKEKDNIFYFFNPFSLNIYKDVVENIILSAEKHKKKVDIIFYYPLTPFKQFMNETPFIKKNKIKVPNRSDRREEFIIYRYNPIDK